MLAPGAASSTCLPFEDQNASVSSCVVAETAIMNLYDK